MTGKIIGAVIGIAAYGALGYFYFKELKIKKNQDDIKESIDEND